MTRVMKTGIDWHAFYGVLGTSTAVVLQSFSTIAAGLAATATAAYMILRAAREWRRLKREENDQVPLAEDFSSKHKQKSKK